MQVAKSPRGFLRGEKTAPAGDKSKLVKLSPEQIARLRGGRQLRNLRVVSNVPLQGDSPVAGDQPKSGEVWGGVRSGDVGGTVRPQMMVDPNSFNPDGGESQDLRAYYGDPTLLRSAHTGDDLFDTQAAAAAMQQGHATKQDDLASTIDSVASNLDAILSKVKRVDHQVGIGLVTEKGLQCIELFDLQESWEAIHKDVVTRVGSDLAKKDEQNVFEYKPQAALNTMVAVLSDGYKVNPIFEHKPSNGEPAVKIFGLTSDRFVGEVVELDGRVVHVSIIRTAA